MKKKILYVLALSLLLAPSAFAKNPEVTESIVDEDVVEARLQRKLNRGSHLTPEQIAEAQANMNKNIEGEILRTTPGEARQLIKYNNYINKSIAESQGTEYKSLEVAPDDKEPARKFYDNFRQEVR